MKALRNASSREASVQFKEAMMAERVEREVVRERDSGAGIMVGVIVGLVLVGLLVYFLAFRGGPVEQNSVDIEIQRPSVEVPATGTGGD
jgi:hypothetical protein